MKKLYVLFTMAALLFTVSANAAVESMADLFGKYKFTATVNVTDAGQSYTEHFKSECDVTIAKCSIGIFDGEISGIAGATSAQSVYAFDSSANTIQIKNPNGNGLWGGGLYMSNPEGIYPFGGTYNDILYTVDPSTKTITMPDFTLVKCDHGAMTATIIATFTNAKLTLVEAENVNVTDLSGDWHFTAGKGTYDVMENSTLPTEWDMTLTAQGDDKRNYDISLKLGEFAPLALTATFDGVTLTIPFNETYFDAEQKIGIVNMYGVARPGEITFNMINENQLSLTSGMVIAQDSISEEVKGGYLQWYMAGSAKKQGAEAPAVTWPGTYTLKSGNFNVFDGGSDFAAESEIVVEYNAEWGLHLVTKFLGYDVVNINYGGIGFEPSATDPNVAYIKLQSAYGGSMYVKSAEGVFYKLVDANGGTESLELKSNGDGTFSLSPFFVVKGEYGKESDYVAGFDQNVLTKQEETKPVEWPGTYTLKSDNFQVFDGGSDFAAESEMVIEYNEGWGIYLVTKFLGYDVVNINYGGIGFEPSATDPLASSILLQSAYGGSMYVKSAEGVFYKLVDEQGGATALELKSNGDGTFSLSPFFVVKGEYGKETTYVAGFSQNVVTKGTSTDITAVETNDNIQVVNGEVVLSEAQPVVVYDFAGRVVFEGTTSHINGLANGMYVVKTPSAVMKVVIK